jgi:hypothetical protein
MWKAYIGVRKRRKFDLRKQYSGRSGNFAGEGGIGSGLGHTICCRCQVYDSIGVAQG